MAGLLDAVLRRGFERYVTDKVDRPRHDDPVQDLRDGWDNHARFGLDHPHIYIALYGSPNPATTPQAARIARDVLRQMVERVATHGRRATFTVGTVRHARRRRARPPTAETELLQAWLRRIAEAGHRA